MTDSLRVICNTPCPESLEVHTKFDTWFHAQLCFTLTDAGFTNALLEGTSMTSITKSVPVVHLNSNA